MGIWDTGATVSVITDKIVYDLNLQSTGMAEVHHAQGMAHVETYMVNIGLPNNVGFAGMTVTKGVLSGADALIGMDIIGQGDFAVSNFDGRTFFSFRVPSTERIDFTGKAPRSCR